MKRFYFIIFVTALLVIGGFGCKEKTVTENKTKEVAVNKTVSSNVNAKEKIININKLDRTVIWQEINGGKYLPVPYYFQKEVPQYGNFACGPTALKMVLEYKRQINAIDLDVPSISDMINLIGIERNFWENSKIDQYFIENFGITDVALKELANELGYKEMVIFGSSFSPNYPTSTAVDPNHKGKHINSENWLAPIDKEGWDLEKLYQTVEEGFPVIVDVTTSLEPLFGKEDARSYNPFYSEDGSQHWELQFGKGHFMVVIGFKNWGEENASIILLDPLNKTGLENNISIYSLDEFTKSWELLNNQGLLLR